MPMQPPAPPRPPNPDERFRLYIDESGDHTWKHLSDPARRYLCLLGCVFEGKDYREFHAELEDFKQRLIPHSPDEPVILHRADILNCRGPFWRLRDAETRTRFDEELVGLCARTRFLVVAVVIDKAELLVRYPEPAHPYHLALGFMLQRYCGYLNHVSRVGDVMAEARGGGEDRLLSDSYERHYERGAWMTRAAAFQRALTSKRLKLKPKSANIAGLQLADLLAHPVKQMVLVDEGHVEESALAPFAKQLLDVARPKFNRQLYDGRVKGYGTVFFPK